MWWVAAALGVVASSCPGLARWGAIALLACVVVVVWRCGGLDGGAKWR